MNIGRWLLVGLPLVVIGAIWGYCGVAFETKGPDIVLMTSVGVIYIVAGLIAASNRPWCRVVAQSAWYPCLLLIPIGTVLGIMAIRILKVDKAATDKHLADMKAVPKEEALKILRTEAADRFAVSESQLEASLVQDLRVNLGDLHSFIEDMEIDHGFRFGPELVPASASILDLERALDG